MHEILIYVARHCGDHHYLVYDITNNMVTYHRLK